MKKEQQERAIQMPINKLSYSALTQFLRNPLIFKLKYILGVYDGKVGMAGMVGKAGHKALQVYYGADPDISTPADRGEAMELALDTGLKFLEQYSDVYIEYGKSGSREQMLKNYNKAMTFYFAEEPEYHEILMAEQKLEGELETIDGDKLPLPATGIPDLVHQRKDGGIEIIDIKFVKSFTDYDTEDYIKIIQSQFLWHLLKKSKGMVADRMLFREVKITENTRENAGKPQVRDYAIPFSHDQYRTFFYNLYKDVVGFIANPNAVYLPNLSDPFDGEQAGLLYAQGLLNSDMSDVEVMHKVKDVAFISKKFVPSRLDRVENAHLNPDEKIKLRLAEFGIPVEPVEPQEGTNVVQYRFKVSAGVRMSVFEKHKADIARAIEAKGEIRILAPIPGTALVGIEVPKENRENVTLDKQHLVPGKLWVPVGVNVNGEPIGEYLDKMPHLLIAGTTGSGKSELLHSVLTALTKQMKPENMRLILIDPKRVELVAFAKAKHLKGGRILYEYADVLLSLKALNEEMEMRYKTLEKKGVRNIGEYNAHMDVIKEPELPYITVVIDEFADLSLQGKMYEKRNKKSQSLSNIVNRINIEQTARQMAKMGIKFTAPKDNDDYHTAEDLMIRLASMGRAAGIHLIITTQRPSVDVITGLIKANFPTRIALLTASATDSKVILGEEGAEKLAGRGDLLFMNPGKGLLRLQGFLAK